MVFTTNPISLVDPTGLLDWNPNGDGTFTAEAGDGAWSLSKDAGISYSEAKQTLAAQGMGTYVDKKDGVEKSAVDPGDKVRVSQPTNNGSPSTSESSSSSQSASSSPSFSYSSGKSPFTMTEINWAGGGDGVSATYGRLDIKATEGAPAGLQGQLTSGNGGVLGFGIGSPIEIMAATKGTIIFDKSVSGNSLQELFSEARYIRTRSIGALIKYTRLDAYTSSSMTTPVFHVNLLGGGVATAGASGSASVVKFKPK